MIKVVAKDSRWRHTQDGRRSASVKVIFV